MSRLTLVRLVPSCPIPALAATHVQQADAGDVHSPVGRLAYV
jgi:hypothetical protein